MLNEKYHIIAKKFVCLFTIFLFITVVFTPPTHGFRLENELIKIGKTLYVGGEGPGNYTKIQDAIDNASDGDTIFVYDDSSPYYETVLNIDKTIKLFGEDRNTTKIYAHITLIADGIRIINFTISHRGISTSSSSSHNIISNNIFIKNEKIEQIPIQLEYSNNNIISKNSFYFNLCNIRIFQSNGNIIKNNIIVTNGYGLGMDYIGGEIFLSGVCNNNIIKNNTLINNGSWRQGIHIETRSGLFGKKSKNNIIEGNIISSFDMEGLIISGGLNNIISGNVIANNSYGIVITRCRNFSISRNSIINNDDGIWIYRSNFNKVLFNNFINNNRSAFFNFISLINKWSCNYWDKPRLFPKLIIGNIGFLIPSWINVDWHPAKEPYDIGV